MPEVIRLRVLVALQVPDLLCLSQAPLPLVDHLPQTLFKIVGEILELLELH